MSRTNTYESRKTYYRHLIRPNGELLSEKDCLLLDLCIQWTKDNNIATSTYKYLLDTKFPRQNHPITVKRTFYNISLYIEAEFKNIHVINGVIHRDKIRIERASNFDLKMEEAKQKNEGKRSKDGTQECRPSSTEMSTMVNRNVDPSIFIYKNTKKNIINDITDNQKNQFLDSSCFSTKNTDFIEANVERLAKDGSKVEIAQPTSTNDIVQTEAKSQEQATIHQFNPLKDRISITDKSGTYWGIPLSKFSYSKSMIEQIRLASKKTHFTHERIVGLFSYIAAKYPNKLILGGKAGFISYMTKVVNGEMEYTKEEKLESIEAKRIEEMKELEDMFNNGRIQWA